MLDILIFIFLGICLGVFTGLAPGIHVNTVSILLLSFAGFIDPTLLAATIVSMAISHSFFDFIPSIFLGAPDPETALSILPGHRLLLAGRGYEAIYLTVAGGLVALLAAVLLSPLFILIIPYLYALAKPHIAIILIFVAAVMTMSETGRKKMMALLVFLAAGALGTLQFRQPVLSEDVSLFVVFTGLFGISTLLISLRSGSHIPSQTLEMKGTTKTFHLIAAARGLLSGSILGTLPGMGAAEAAVLAQQLPPRKRGKDADREFLATIGAVNITVTLFSIISLYTIARARSGAAVAIEELLGTISMHDLLLFIGTAAVAAGISSVLALFISRKAIPVLSRINYKKLTIFTLLLLISLTGLMAGLAGLLVLFASASIGLLAPLFGVKRSNCMGVLMMPLILFYLGL